MPRKPTHQKHLWLRLTVWLLSSSVLGSSVAKAPSQVLHVGKYDSNILQDQLTLAKWGKAAISGLVATPLTFDRLDAPESMCTRLLPNDSAWESHTASSNYTGKILSFILRSSMARPDIFIHFIFTRRSIAGDGGS